MTVWGAARTTDETSETGQELEHQRDLRTAPRPAAAPAPAFGASPTAKPGSLRGFARQRHHALKRRDAASKPHETRQAGIVARLNIWIEAAVVAPKRDRRAESKG